MREEFYFINKECHILKQRLEFNLNKKANSARMNVIRA